MTIKLTRAGGQQMPFFDSFPLYAMILFIIGCILSCILLLVLLAILIIVSVYKDKNLDAPIEMYYSIYN